MNPWPSYWLVSRQFERADFVLPSAQTRLGPAEA
jgi:hypothetical protein